MQNQFLLDINPNIELPKYDLILTKLNEEPITSLKNIENFEIKAYFANIDEISFRIPFYRTDNDGTQVKNELFDLVDGSMMVLLNDMQYFILTKPEIKTDEKTGKIYKDILGYSREYEFAQKRLVGYEGVSRKIYDYNNDIDENGLEWGFFNHVLKNTSWRLGYINSNVLAKRRHISFAKATYLQAFQEIQKTFGCLFKYDTINKVIDIYEVTQLGKNQGLYISDRNFINNLNQTINHDEIKTRLFLYGKDNISIQSINVTGQPYIENFDFFKSTKYMSQGLIDSLNRYEEYIATKDGVFRGYLEELETLNSNLLNAKIELADLITQLKLIENTFDNVISENEPTENINDQLTKKIQEVNDKQIEIDTISSQIDVVRNKINNLSVDVSLNNHLTSEEIKELDPFIREDEFSDSNYTEDNLEELLLEGKKILNKISYPNIQFNVDVVSFLDLVEAQHIWDKFVLGDLVTLVHEELNFDYEVRLVGYTHAPDDNKLSLIFSNRDSVDDANIYLKELLEDLTTTASTVDFNKYKWDKGEQANFIINQYVDSALNLAKQQILKADGQKPIMDERGIWLYKENPDGSINPKQMRLINNVLAITNDNWNTVSIAISGDGINAELIRGKLGQFAEVHANQIIVGSNGEKISQDVLDIDGVVMQEELYNQVVITQENGLQVLDRANRERVRLGNYKLGKYGMVIKDKSGSTTILDEDGILQTWQEGKADNVDVNKPLNLYLYIPEQTNIIHKALLRFKRERFRAYSTSTISYGGTVLSSRNGGHYSSTTVADGHYSSSTAAGGGQVYTTHEQSDIIQDWVLTRPAGADNHRHEFMKTLFHEHKVTFPEHSHDFEIPEHSHDFEIPEHSHELEIPPHKHDIEYGIYESLFPSNIRIRINGTDYSKYLGAKTGVFNKDRDNIDITPLLKVGQWNTITISSDTLGRIDASVFIQALINTTRKSVILDDRYINRSSIGFGIGFRESVITGRRLNVESGVDYLYRVSINNNIANVYSLRWTGGSDYGWVNEFNLGNASAVAIVMDGTWVHDGIENKFKLQTEEYPYLFWVSNGNLYVQKWKDSENKRLLSQNVTKVSSIRGWKNNTFITQDQGIVCAYIKTDGKVYYRNYCTQANGSVAWEKEREVTDFVGTATNVNLFITNDYRIGFVIEDNLNKTHILITDRNWAGMAIAPSKITAKPNINVGFIETTKHKGYFTERITSKPNIALNFLYASSFNEFTHIENIDDGTGNFGIKVKIKTKYRIYNCLSSEFRLTDGNNISFNCEGIENISPNEFVLTFMDFNNAVGEVKLSYVRTSGTNEAGYAFDDFEGTFIPTGLVPTQIPVPEVEAIWNE